MSDDLSPEALETAYEFSQLDREDRRQMERLVKLICDARDAVLDDVDAMMRTTPSTADIDEHRRRMDALIAFLEQRRAH